MFYCDCILCPCPVQILTLFINIWNAFCTSWTWSLEELLYADEPVDKSHDGGEKASEKETDCHPHHKLVLIHVPYNVLLGKHRDGGVAEDLDGGDSKEPDEIHDEGAAEEESHAAVPGEVNGESAGEVVEEVAVGNEDGDGAEEEENGDGGSNAVHHDGVGDEGRRDDDHRVLAEVDEEVGEAEEAEEDAGCSEKAVGDLESPLRALLVLLLLSPWVRVRNIHLVSELKSRKSSNWFHSPHKQS